MRWIRLTIRVMKALAVAYTLWRGLMRGRWLAAGFALWRILQRDRQEDVSRRAAAAFLGAGDPAIYRRKGWRKLGTRFRRAPMA
ncbi:hypothetical protein JI721_01175 [Alicyclobacillus cycloheptanicus]|uniref:Uncharacterized protein n=1 Tax=Alicyclobacillus cycloheptanicus TaxID=1457 RepID=A0ABT9XLQ6_9BACL|nr:hypothetical protein [Alicyclobacillus cycloheptanicus]MDQ0191241.1 hypothetical protein [Alicyclobacillus cycloheptanicus]WDM01523.1 hypothetical protein JI721_01175 [Alicyclobacillus cycloheptanicus]